MASATSPFESSLKHFVEENESVSESASVAPRIPPRPAVSDDGKARDATISEPAVSDLQEICPTFPSPYSSPICPPAQHCPRRTWHPTPCETQASSRRDIHAVNESGTSLTVVSNESPSRIRRQSSHAAAARNDSMSDISWATAARNERKDRRDGRRRRLRRFRHKPT